MKKKKVEKLEYSGLIDDKLDDQKPDTENENERIFQVYSSSSSRTLVDANSPKHQTNASRDPVEC